MIGNGCWTATRDSWKYPVGEVVVREGENPIWPGRWSRLRDGRWSGIVQTENTVRHTKYGRIRGIWSLVRVVVRQGFYCIAVRLTKWCISQTSAMLFAPVHGGCYIISSVGIEYSCGLSVMWCILSVYTIWVFWLCHGWVSKKKKNWIGGGWVGWALSNFCVDFWNFFNFAKPLTRAPE